LATRIASLSPTSWVTAQNLLRQLFSVGLFAIQAPLLGPHAFGLIALVMVFIGFCEFVLEITGTDALISVRDIDAQHYATMTTINVVASLSLGLAVFVFSRSIAATFAEPELVPILRCMAPLPLISVLTAAPNAACRRELKFQPLVARVLMSTVAGGVVGLVLTFLHFGVWALVWQAIVQRVLNVAILWKLVSLPFRLGFSVRHFHELRRYAAPMFVSQTMSWVTEQIPRYVLGLYLGASELGLFSMAARLADIVLQLAVSPRFGVARIEMREFARDSAGLGVATRRVLLQMGLLSFPLCIGAAVVMPVLFDTWLNAKWSGGVLAAQLMLLGTMPYVTHYGLSASLLGMNRQSATAVSATTQAATMAIVAIVFAPWGLNWATAAIALRPALTAAVPVWFARRYFQMSLRAIVQAQVPALLIASTMGIVVWLLRLALAQHLANAAQLALLVTVGMVSYGALVMHFMLPELPAPISTRLQRLRERF